jgi:hypothetical protein
MKKVPIPRVPRQARYGNAADGRQSKIGHARQLDASGVER